MIYKQHSHHKSLCQRRKLSVRNQSKNKMRHCSSTSQMISLPCVVKSHQTCRQRGMLLDGCRVCPESQGSTLSDTHANSYTAAAHAASFSKERHREITMTTITRFHMKTASWRNSTSAVSSLSITLVEEKEVGNTASQLLWRRVKQPGLMQKYNWKRIKITK